MSITETALRDVRLIYNAAHTAYQTCAQALNEASVGGKRPSAELLKNEATALRELTTARANLLAALRAFD